VSEDSNGARLAGYLDSLRTQRQLSPHTLSNYQRDLLQLVTFAAERELAAISQFDIRRFAAKLHAQGLNPRSIARQLSAWRGFYRWLSEQTTLASNPVDGVKAPRRAKTLPKALSADDAIRLVAQTLPVSGGAPQQAQQLCNRAMFELLYSSGLRVSELVGLDLHHAHEGGYTSLGWIDSESHEVTVTGKGSKMRSVPVGQPALDAIAAWLAVRPQLANGAADAGDPGDHYALFLGSRGKRISPRQVQLRIKAQAQALGIPANVHPHVLRHSFASHLLQSSGDLRAVQEMLGHASITSTQVYTSLDFQRLAQVYDAAHPRAKKK
jgi:integrase/recombinase XerC